MLKRLMEQFCACFCVVAFFGMGSAVGTALAADNKPECVSVATKECNLGFGEKGTGFNIRARNCGSQVNVWHKYEAGTKSPLILLDHIKDNTSLDICPVSKGKIEIFHYACIEGDQACSRAARGKPVAKKIPAEPKSSEASRKQLVRDVNNSLLSPENPEFAATVKMIGIALDFSTLEDKGDRQDFENRVHGAWNEVLEVRNENAKLVKSIPLRNADYYLMGLYAGLSKDAYLSSGIDGGDIYMMLKGAAQTWGPLEKLMRSNPDLPTTPAGGTDWAQAGLLEGRVLRDTWVSIADAKLRKRVFPK